MEDVIFKCDAVFLLSKEIDAGNLLDFNNVIGITLGTNVGLAHYLNRKVTGINLERSKFLDGKVQDYFSAGWIIKRWKQLTDTDLSSIEEISDIPNESNWADLLFDEFSKNLSDFLYILIKKKEASAVVLGGDIVNNQPLVFLRTQEHLYHKMGISIPILTDSVLSAKLYSVEY